MHAKCTIHFAADRQSFALRAAITWNYELKSSSLNQECLTNGVLKALLLSFSGTDIAPLAGESDSLPRFSKSRAFLATSFGNKIS